MKTIAVLLALLPMYLSAQHATDGPYIIYRNDDSAVVKVLLQQEDLIRPASSVLAVSALPGTSFTVPVANHPEWAFPIQAHASLLPAPVTYPASEKILVLSDIEGEFEAGRQLLIAAGVIDTTYNWTFGKGQVVVAGDLFDRGQDVLPWLWLLYSLETKAAAAGGWVHVLLGNHDIMQLSGDYRYTDARYFKHAWVMGREIRNLFGADTELGRWLRSKNIIEKGGDYLFMHAGLSPEVLQKQLSLQAINEICRPYYGMSRKEMPDSMHMFFDARSPFWYRGYFMKPQAPKTLIDSTLKQYACRTIVVGHTITDTTITMHYKGKVIAVDVNQHEGHHAALLIEGHSRYIIDDKGNKTALINNKQP
ncbi:metallophosphoesterase [Filimonas effusa]|uniref:Metallophosphoesterase n=1 Tax=Filimonas effusa TaxID=2508721 RepID=A0A4Q1DA08_9BACT|nr:metallophosphoesterase [Filimonas effusa]RXK86201.1 metallophosphoesterase [Filimonas effusa]